jgi:DNA-binding CsgD family transcriptional regulator
VLPFAVLLLALVAVEHGDLDEAARFHGMVRGRLEQLRPATPPQWLDLYVARLADVRSRVGDQTFETQAAKGERDMHANALAEVLGYADRVAGSAPPVIPAQREAGPDHLTPRELEVLEELITGATNKEISRRLGMSPKTVMHHSGAIYRKLGVRGRAEATAWAFRRGLVD